MDEQPPLFEPPVVAPSADGFETEDAIAPTIPADEIVDNVTPIGDAAPGQRWLSMRGIRTGNDSDIGPNGRNGRRRKREPKPVPPKPREGSLVKPLTELYAFMGMAVVPFDQPCGTAIVANAEQCAKALENLARENPAMRRALLALCETSVWGQVIAAHMPIALAIASHHVGGVAEAMQGLQHTPGAESVEDYLRTRQNGNGGGVA